MLYKLTRPTAALDRVFISIGLGSKLTDIHNFLRQDSNQGLPSSKFLVFISAAEPKTHTEVLNFSPEPSKTRNVNNGSPFVLKETNAVDCSNFSDSVFLPDGTTVNTNALTSEAVPQVVVEDFGSCSKVDQVGTLVPQKTKKVTFSASVIEVQKSPKRPAPKENVAPEGNTNDEAPAPKKVYRKTSIIDADEENRKMEEQCKQQ